jgi:hypothetical protein
MEIDRREPSDSVSSAATLVRGVTPPIGKRDSTNYKQLIINKYVQWT